MNINTLFGLLDDWKHLPGYQLERRADIFFALHLKIIFEKVKGVKIDIIIPEFPIQKNSLPFHSKFNIKPLKRPNQSFQIDYLCYSNTPIPKVYFIELKTEVNSRNNKQDWYLKNAKKIKIDGLLKGLKEIYENSNQKGKYNNLLKMLVEANDINWVKMNSESFDVLETDIEPEIIYIQPRSDENKDSIITFNEIIEHLKGAEEPLTKRFLESLKKWQMDYE
jgi:hypothetical protein